MSPPLRPPSSHSSKSPLEEQINELTQLERYHEQLRSWLYLEHCWQQLGNSVIASHLNAKAVSLLEAFQKEKRQIAAQQALSNNAATALSAANSSRNQNAARSQNRRNQQSQPAVPQSRMHRSRDNVDREYLSFMRVGQFRRAFADFIDIVFYVLCLLVIVTIVNLITSILISHKSQGILTLSLFDVLKQSCTLFKSLPVKVKINFLLIAFIFEVFGTQFFGSSLGKYLLSLRIVSSYKVAHNRTGFVWVTPGTAPKFNQILIRSIFKVTGLLFFPIFHLTAMSRHRTFYDTIAATLVVGNVRTVQQ
ncbi:MAG: hypothetical protein MHMPM18_002013 [Marteilia pararefringens]